ncbi:MAG: ester cyclase [Solirubrobacteraceae bacterium]
MPETNEAILRTAADAFNDPSRRERYLDLYDAEVVLHGYPRGLAGRTGAVAFYSQLWEAFPDARLTVDASISSGDQVAARYRLSGVQARDFYGAPVTRATGDLEGIAWLRFHDGRIVEVWQTSGTLDTVVRLAARASAAPRRSASAEAAALRWEEQHEQ